MAKLSRTKAIRAKCLDCCCGSAPEVRRCPVKTCPLWVFRMGSPSRCGITLGEAENLFSIALGCDSEVETASPFDEVGAEM